jgi:hypothetical protein
MQKLDNHGRYNLYGVYLECKNEMDSGINAFPKGVTKSKEVTYRTFAMVIKMYFKISFEMLLKGMSVPLLNKFGILNIVKTKCIRYNPFRFAVYKDESGKVISKKVKIKLRSGYWYFVFWDSPKKWRQYRFNINIKYKRAYMELVNDGFDYLDYTLDGYGRNASIDYIQHIK